jgi:hypothetical protein
MDDQGWADALIKLLGGQFTVAGVILVGFVLFIIALNRNALVTGPRYKDCKETCDNCNATLATARAELKQCETDYTNARITIVRHEEREFLSRQWPLPAPPPRPGSPLPDPEGGSS